MNKTITHPPLTLSYRVEGKGLPVLLIHGFAEDSTVWDSQVGYLKDHYRLIIPDLPGSGPSGSSAFPSGTPTLETQADLLKDLLDEEGIRQAVLIGHSMGGYIALSFAAKYPDRIKALGLFHSTAYADSNETTAGRQKNIEFIRKTGSAAFIRQSTPNMFAISSRNEHPEWINARIDRYAGFNPDALIYYQQAMIARPDRSSILQQFNGPVLFIIGQQDALIPLDASLRQTHLPVLSYIHLLENSGHMGMLENSAESNRILDDFLRPLSIQ